MNEQRIIKLLRKHNLQVKSHEALIEVLKGRKIHKKTIRNNVCVQRQKSNKVYCLLKGSVKIYYKIMHELNRHAISEDQQSTLKKHRQHIYEQQNLTFTNLDSEYEIINDEIILDYLQKQRNQYYLMKLEEQSHINPQINGQTQIIISQNIKKHNNFSFRNKFSVTVVSSQCEYIELHFQQAIVFLQSKLNLIRKKMSDRQTLIDKVQGHEKDQNSVNQKQNIFDKLSLPNIKLKNIHQAQQVFQINQIMNNKQIAKSVSLLKLNSAHEKIKIINNNEQKQIQPDYRMKTMSNTISNKIFSSKKNNLDKPIMMQIRTPKTQTTQIDMFDQNEKILQKYRSNKIFQFIPKSSSYSQNKIASKNIKNHQLQNKKSQKERLFKQQLKKIIKNKLKFQKRHRQVIKEFANIQSEQIYSQINDRHNLKNKLKLHSNRKTIGIGVNLNMLNNGMNGHNQNKLSKQNKAKIYNKSNFDKQTLRLNRISQNSNRNNPQSNNVLQSHQSSQRYQPYEVQNRFSEQLFRHFEDIDSYFDKIQ